MSSLFGIAIFNSIVTSATFFIIPTLGEIYSERAGVLNLGIEGMIIASAASSYSVAYFTQNLWLGVVIGILIGIMLSLVHAITTITFMRNQVVSGIALTIMGTGLSGLVGQNVVGKSLKTFQPIKIPILYDIPIVGAIFFNHDIIVYLAYVLVVITWFILFKTRIGIIIRTVGENPSAAHIQGINVKLTRYLATLFGGAMSGLAGAYLSLAWFSFWSDGMTNGRGWIVIALTIVAFWNPIGAFFGSLLFGAFERYGFALQPFNISVSLLNMMPYIFTIFFLLIWTLILNRQEVKRIIGAPRSLTVPFEAE